MLAGKYNKQITKRERIKATTLVVGMDIGCSFNALVLMNKSGEVLGKYPRIFNSRKGFDYFLRVIEGTKKKYGMKDVLIGMEPTGQYWRKIAYFSQAQGYEVRFIRTTALKHQRELDESSPAKSDLKDALVISNIVREGKYLDTEIIRGVYRELRTLGKVRDRTQRNNTANKNALKGVLDDYFPELKRMFWSMKAKGLWAILELCPFPEDVMKLDVNEIAEAIARASKRRATAYKKALQLVESARHSVGLKDIGVSDRYRVKIFLDGVKRTEAQLKDIEKEMGKLLEQVPYSEQLLSIPGIGVLSAAIFFGELGDPGNFNHYKQMTKYSGYDPVEKDSGAFVGRRRISKKGRYLLRKYLYFMSMRVVHRSGYFKDYYNRKLNSLNRFGRPLSKKEALCSVAIKLIKVIFALFRDGRRFEEQSPVRMAMAA